jgi:predicted DNA-binding WGR domain protein
MTRRYEMQDGGSAKFWEVGVSGAELTVRFGKLGTEGQTKVKALGSTAGAAKEMDKLIREKTAKGYLEVVSSAGVTEPSSVPAVETSELSVLRSDEAQSLRDALGELTVLGVGEEPEILGGFRMQPIDGDAWTTVLGGIEWLFEEADGGAVGRYRSGSACVIYLDNEGQFRLSPTLIDHLAWKDDDGEFAGEIARLAKKHGLPLPLSKAAREKSVRGLPTPEALVEDARTSAAKNQVKASKDAPQGGKPGKAAAAKAQKAAAVEKGPRPLCRGIQVTFAPDGTLYTLSGEDYGGAYGEKLTRGATFRFDPSTSSFVRLPAQPVGDYGLPVDSWACWPFAPEACLDSDAWRERGLIELAPEVKTDFVARRLSDGTWVLVAGYARSVFRYAGGELARVGALPEVRSRDEVVELGGARLLLANGERNYSKVLGTLIVDLAAGTIAAGPDLPGEHGRFGGDQRGRAFLLHGYAGHAEMPATLSIFEGNAWVSHPLPEELLHPEQGIVHEPLCALSTGEVLLFSWHDRTLATLDLGTRKVTPAGRLRTNSGARGYELSDGRVLIVGGTLFNNIDAEPEIWDPTTRTTSCLPGYDKEVAKQERELAKYREKQRR